MIGLGLNTAADTSHPALFAPAGYASTEHIAFDGVSEYGQIQAGESFFHATGTTGGSISVWVRGADMVPSTNNQINYLLGAFGGSFPFFKYFYLGFQRYNLTDRLVVLRKQLHFSDSSQTKTWVDSRSSTNVSLADNTWHHIAFTTAPFMSTWRSSMYLNGSSVAMSVVGSTTASNTDSYYDSQLNMTVSRYSTVYDAFDVNELGVWSSELTSSEVTEIYNQGVSGFDLSQDTGDYVSSSDLYSWHKMGDEDQIGTPQGPAQPDSSGNNREMVLFNTPTVATT